MEISDGHPYPPVRKFFICQDCDKPVDRDYPHACRVQPAYVNPPPEGGYEEVTPLAIDYLKARAEKGAQKYGSRLKTFNGRSSLVDALEESADLFQYLFQKCREEGLV
jgi:hypothetical protein